MSTREIVAGDTLNAIARDLGITLDDLLAANPQFAANPDLIYPGQQVVIPTGGTTDEEPADTTTPTAAPNDALPTAEQVAADQAALAQGLPTQVGKVTIPAGARLVSVGNPAGSDERRDYYLVYSIYGTEVAYRVGGQARMDELFPGGGLASFSQYEGMNQARFDQQGFTVLGEVDEILGSTESLQSVFERDLRAAGLESLPAWMLNDPEAMGIVINGANEGWSEGRTWKALQATDGFRGRFPGLAEYMGRNQLADVRSAVTAYVNQEQSLSAVLRNKRGANTNTSPEYLGGLIAAGWTPQEADQVLEGEVRLQRNPEAFQQFQQLMALQGQQVGMDDFLDVFRGKAQPDVMEILNDTFRFQALADQGLNVDASFAEFLGAGVSTSLTPNGFTEAAQQAAQAVLRFGMELDAGAFGLSREDVIAAAFDQESPSGRAPADVSELLLRFGRDRAQRARGLAGFQAYINQQNRLQVAGLG